MSLLTPLTRTALLGTATEPVVRPAAPPPLDAILAQVDTQDGEAALLNLVSVAGFSALAGYVPAAAENILPAALPDSRKIIPDAAAQCFKRALAGEFEDVLPEFLQRVARRGMYLPPEMLPAILSLGKYELRSLVQPVIGERGRWLAAQNPNWAYAFPRDPQEAWENGSRLERVAALEALRAQQPSQGRALLQSTWQQEAAEERAAFLVTLATGLSMQDEPFLEGCLDDKRKGVRIAAKALLVRLPSSRLVQRMHQRLNQFVDFKAKIFGSGRFEILLPDKLDAATQRDGILDDTSDTIQYRKMGEKASWLALMLALVPPALWSRQWGKPPEKLLVAALASEWNKPLLVGLCAATQLSQDVDWAQALVTCWLKQPTCRSLVGKETWWHIVALLPERVMEALVLAHIKPGAAELTDGAPITGLLAGYKRPWTDKMALAVIQSAQRLADPQGRTRGQAASYEFSQAFPSFALWISPSLVGQAARGWPPGSQGVWRSNQDKFLALLRFRRQVHEALP